LFSQSDMKTRYDMNYEMQFLPTNNEIIISISVDTRSLGSDMRFSDDHLTESTLEVLATPF